jgi:hypothetical protein
LTSTIDVHHCWVRHRPDRARTYSDVAGGDPVARRREFEPGFQGQPFKGCDGGRAFGIMADAMRDVYGWDVSLQGDDGSIPLSNVLEVTFPDA